MKYEDIKDLETSRTHSLYNVRAALPFLPLGAHTELLSHRYEIGRSEHPSIETILHTSMELDSNHCITIFSVLVDGVPAFWFIANGRGDKANQHYYPLNTQACKQCVNYLVELVLEVPVEVLPPEVSEDEDIEALTEFNGVKILYGGKYYLDTGGTWQRYSDW